MCFFFLAQLLLPLEYVFRDPLFLLLPMVFLAVGHLCHKAVITAVDILGNLGQGGVTLSISFV